MATKIQVRRDTAANWTSVNPTLSDGELGYETNTGYMKIGNGSTQWSSLSYFTPGAVDGDANTTYTLGTTASGSDANITLTGSDSTNDSVKLVAGTNVTLSVAGDNITAAVDTDLANYNNANTGFITASSSSALTNKTGNISQWTNDSGYLTSGTISISGKSINELSDVSTGGAVSGAHLVYDGSNWTQTFNFNSSGTTFLSGFSLNRYIEYKNSLITIGSISSGDTVDFPTSSTGMACEFQVNNPGTDFVANLTPGPTNINRSQYFRIVIDNTSGGTKGSISGIKRLGQTQTVNWINGSLPTVTGADIYDIYDIYCFRGNGGSDETWYAELITAPKTTSGYGANNPIPAARLSGTLPALDASNLTNIPPGDFVLDTTPQLGGDLDLNGNDITGTGSIELETNKSLTFKTTVSGNNQDIGSIIASNGTNDFNKVSFKTGPDDYANNGEVNWATRVNGTLTSIFEINGSSLAKSGMVINPDSNAGIDFQIKGNNDGLLVFVDSGLDKVGIGKVPANGILDVDGDVYATNFQGNVTGNVTGNIGNFSLASSVIDTTDSSGITVTPAVTMSSDLTVENNLVVDNAIQSANLTVSGTTTANGIAVFEQGVIEGFSSLASATGTVAHNCANGHIFRHTGISADFTANFTNLGITDDHGTMVSLILVQGGTAYIPTAVQIDGAAQTILWQGGSAPSGTASGTDIVSFSITQSAGTRTVLGQLTSYS